MLVPKVVLPLRLTARLASHEGIELGVPRERLCGIERRARVVAARPSGPGSQCVRHRLNVVRDAVRHQTGVSVGPRGPGSVINYISGNMSLNVADGRGGPLFGHSQNRIRGEELPSIEGYLTEVLPENLEGDRGVKGRDSQHLLAAV